jgi:hypothetical protein
MNTATPYIQNRINELIDKSRTIIYEFNKPKIDTALHEQGYQLHRDYEVDTKVKSQKGRRRDVDYHEYNKIEKGELI